MVVEVAQRLDQAGKRGGENWLQETVAQAACRAAVATRQTLTTKELDALVQDLARCEMPYTSPFGRPTLILTSFNELSRKFGRPK
jgi:DNA mismatch repair protein MutL